MIESAVRNNGVLADLALTQREQQIIAIAMAETVKFLLNPPIKFYVVPGGHKPERKTEIACGYDFVGRAVVHKREMDPVYPYLRRTLFDFQNPPDDDFLRQRVIEVDKEKGVGTELALVVKPGDSFLIALGVITSMPDHMFYWVAPRSGLARDGVSITNAPGTIDADYLGEAGALLENRGSEAFLLRPGMRITQGIFSPFATPEFIEVADYNDLPQTDRGAGGFGSTGLS